tara:strand:- start:523 stop:1725 length:1203 start_codon:yes stop_codon:yes gene_type:complete
MCSRNYLLIALSLCISSTIWAQYDVSYDNNQAQGVDIVQIDVKETSTLVHFRYTNNNTSPICINEDSYIQNPATYKKYNLLNSINLPLCENKHQFDTNNQIHHFTLEFEKTPLELNNFSIIEEDGWNIENITIDYSSTNEQIDVSSFVDITPLKETGYYLKDGNTIMYTIFKGITVEVLLSSNNSYGKYWQVDISIKNLSGKSFNFYPSEITAKIYKENKKSNDDFLILEADVLTYDEYMKIVNRRQNWNTAMVALGESMAANNAGHSSSTSRSSTRSYSNTNSSAYGSLRDNYGNSVSGSIYGNSSTYGSSYTTKYAKSYSGADAYWAQQNASQNIANYQSKQYSVKNTLSEGYLKANTLNNETEYIGYINIKSSGQYKNAKHIGIIIPINGHNFVFSW